MSGKLVYAWVPGLPHLLRPELNSSYGDLSNACKDLALEFERRDVRRIMFYSTQWLSVLGQSVQARPHLAGLHVDENWHEMASLNFDFSIDLTLVEKLIFKTRESGLQIRAVDYEGFPVDTGTIVANSLINRRGLKTAMYSCCVYSDYQETVKIGEIMARASETMDGRTGVVVVSGLSGRYFTNEINYGDDKIRDPLDDNWNKKVLLAMNEGRWSDVESMRLSYAREAKVDMGFKGLAILQGAGACEPGKRLVTKAYGAVYGTGAAVMLGD